MITLFSVATPAIKQGGARYVFPGGKFKKEVSKQTLELANLLLMLSKESCLALKERRFSMFDALLMNQRCQITACQVYSAVLKPELFREASEMEGLVAKAEAALQTFKAKNVDLTALKDAKTINFPISLEMQQMIRFYLLRKTRTIVPNGTGFRHSTDFKMLDSISSLGAKAKDSLVRSLQKEESDLAANYILERAKALSPFSRQAILIEEVAKKTLNQSGVNQLSVFYTLEVCLRDFSGPIKVVDLNQGGSLTFQFPESTLITQGPDAEAPLLRIDGYFENGDLTPLAESVKQAKVFEFILMAGAQEVRRNPALDKCTEDMKKLLSLPEQTSFPFQLKHFYTASAKEVL